MSATLTETATGGASDVSSTSPATSSGTASPTGDASQIGRASTNDNASRPSGNPTSADSSPTIDSSQEPAITSTQQSGSRSSSRSTYSYDTASASASYAALLNSPAVSNETSDTAFNPSVAGWPFNSTVEITLNATSPMLDLDGDFKIDPSTGYRTLAQYIGGMMIVRFVGVGYTINGISGLGPGESPPNEVYNRLYKIPRRDRVLWRQSAPGKQNLGTMNGLDLRSYYVSAGFGYNSNITFHNATIEVPVRTQAPNLSALYSQSNYLSIIPDGTLSPYVKTRYCSVTSDLGDLFTLSSLTHPNGSVLTFYGTEMDGRAIVADDHVRLEQSTEIIYSVPPNTTLVEVLGPSGTNPNWEGDGKCYAFLNPRPKWWQSPNYPVSMSRKGINATDQSMFIFPIDPETVYEIRVGAYGEGNTCAVSGIRTYPFHYNFTTNLVSSQTNATNDTDPSGQGSGAANNKRTNATPTIVGAVIGVVGGLALIGIVVWYIRRRRRRRAEREQKLLPNPYFDDGTAEPRTKEELGRMARGEDPGGPAAAAQESSGDARVADPPRRVLVQEEDGQTIFEYLPPQYREDWQVGAASGSRPMPDARQRMDTRRQSDGAGQMVETPAAPVTDPALQAKADGFGNADRPALKQEYARAFPRSLPRPPQSPSGPWRSGTDASGLDLREEYKRRFGSSTRYSDLRRSRALSNITPSESDRPLSSDSASFVGEAGPSHNDTDLREEYKKWFS